MEIPGTERRGPIVTRGSKSNRRQQYNRDATEVGRFKTGSAVGVSTYSNLFNINPVIKDCGLVVFDDAHGGEQYAAATWTVTVEANQRAGQYSALVAVLRPGAIASPIL